MIDTLVIYGKWPFRRINFDWDELVKKMEENNVERAMVMNVNGVFYRDVSESNFELLEEMERLPENLRKRFMTVGTINPFYPGWRDDIDFLADSGVRILALFPNYHDYSLSDPSIADFWKSILKHDFIISIVAKFEDSRQRHRLDADDVSENDVIDLLRKYKDLKIILHNFSYSSSVSIYLSNPDHEYMFFDLNFFYEVPIGEPTKFFRIVGEDRIVFSSMYPFRYYKAGIMKLEETEILGSANFEGKLREALK